MPIRTLPENVLKKLREPDSQMMILERVRSQSGSRGFSSSSQKFTPNDRFYYLSNIIRKQVEHLRHLENDMEHVNRDISEIFEKNCARSHCRKLSLRSVGSQEVDSSSSNDESGPEETLTIEDSIKAKRSLLLAHRASEEFFVIVEDTVVSHQLEEKDLLNRAFTLNHESETFKKMGHQALRKIHTHHPQYDLPITLKH